MVQRRGRVSRHGELQEEEVITRGDSDRSTYPFMNPGLHTGRILRSCCVYHVRVRTVSVRLGRLGGSGSRARNITRTLEMSRYPHTGN